MAIHIGYSMHQSGFTSSARKPPQALGGYALMKDFQSNGQFWLPETPEQPLWGRLHYVPGEGTTIHLEGNIKNRLGNTRGIRFSEVHGRLFNGTPCVLREAWGYIESFITKDEHYQTVLSCKLFLLGIAPETSNIDRFATSTVKFTHLDNWLDNPLKLEYSRGDNFKECTITFDPDQNEARTEFENVPLRLRVLCSRTVPFAATSKGVELTFSYILELTPDEPQSLAWHLRATSLIRELFMFLVGSGVYTLDMQIFSSPAPDGQIHVFPIITIPMVVRLDPTYFYSRHAQVRALLPKLIANWFSKRDDLAAVRHTISDLLTVDGISPEAIFTRVVQTMEHLHGLVAPDEGRYVPKIVWRRFTNWIRMNYESAYSKEQPEDQATLLKNKDALIGRIGGVNSLSFRTRIRNLFESVPESELMPIIDNPRNATDYVDTLMPQLEATRHYLTHFSADQKELALTSNQLQTPTLQCWSVLIFNLARFLGLDESISGDIALAARNTMFLVGTSTQL